MKPQLHSIAVHVAERSVAPGTQFKLEIQAVGDDLPLDGEWINILIQGKLLTRLHFTSRPASNKDQNLVWVIELTAPSEAGIYTNKVVLSGIDTEKKHINFELAVQIPHANTETDSIDFFSKETDKPRTHYQIYWEKALFLGLSLLIVLLFFSFESLYFLNETVFNKTEYSAKNSEFKIIQPDAAKTDKKLNRILNQSFSADNWQTRRRAWKEFLQLSKIEQDHPLVKQSKLLLENHRAETFFWFNQKTRLAETITRLKFFASLADAESQYYLAQCFETGLGVKKDYYNAREWYKTAKLNGSTEAVKQIEILDIAADGLLNSNNQSERKLGYQLARSLANDGNVNAQLWLAYRYEKGDGIEKEWSLARQWYQKAADQGSKLARERLKTNEIQ